MTHYTCRGNCKGVSTNPGHCQAMECDHYGKELEACECADGLHNSTPAETQPTTE